MYNKAAIFEIKNMKPLFILLVGCIVSNIMIWLVKGAMDYALAGKIALALMLVFTALGHHMYTQGMMLMLPDFIPFKRETVYITGLFEVLAAVGLFIPLLSQGIGVLLIIFFLAILPANIRACQRYLNYETGAFDGHGPSYLWFRIPFQLLLICWTYYFVIR